MERQSVMPGLGFEAAVQRVRDGGAAQASQDEQLRLYGLFKVATSEERPPAAPPLFCGPTGRAKLRAWQQSAADCAASRAEARARYCSLVAAIERRG